MKKAFATGLAALALVALSGQPAAAWVNARVGLGVNLGWQSAGNLFCWGLWHNGEPPPGYGYDHGHHDHHGFYRSMHGSYVYVPYVMVGGPHHTHHQPAPNFQAFTPFEQYSSGPAFYYYQPD